MGKEGATGRPQPEVPSPWASGPPEAGRVGAADRPGRLPAAAAAPGRRRRRRRRLERFAGPGGGAAGALETPPRGRPARGLCVLSNYLFIEKKRGGRREKKEVTCPGYTYAEKQQKEGKMKASRRRSSGEEAAQAVAAAARPGTDTHLYECACGS